MPSDSDQHSSSSPPRDRNRASERSRSRSKERGSKRSSYDAPYPSESRKVRIRIPELTSGLLSFRSFLSYQNERINTDYAQRAYDKYKKDWEEKQHETFLSEYRNDAWFREKYDPEFLDAIENQRRESINKNYEQFVANLENKVYDAIDLSIKDHNSIGYTLHNDRYDDDEESSSALMNSQTIDIGLNQSYQIGKQPYFGFDPDVRTLFIKSVPKSISRFDIRQVVRQLKGFKNITVSEPAKKNMLSRYCWIEFSDDESLSEAEMALSGLMIKDQKLNCSKSVSKMKKLKVIKNYPLSRISEDLEASIAMLKKLDNECEIKENPILTTTFENEKKNLDIILLYLRRVHAFDYFTCSSYENERMLSLKLGSSTVRIEADYQEMAGVQTVFKKIKQTVLNKANESIQVPDYFGVLKDEIEDMIRETEKLAKNAKKDVWKCFSCDKKFKTCEFLAKHMIKHPDIKNKKIQKIMDEAYIKDPNKITNPLTSRDQRDSFRGGRRPYNPNFRRGGGRRENYRDFDEPEGEKTTKVVVKPMINYLDI